jgi:hypothetical protein
MKKSAMLGFFVVLALTAPAFAGLGYDVTEQAPRVPPWYPYDTQGQYHNFANHVSHIRDFMDPDTKLMAYRKDPVLPINDTPEFYNHPDTTTWHGATLTGVLYALMDVQKSKSTSFTNELKGRLNLDTAGVKAWLETLANEMLDALITAETCTGTPGVMVRSFVIHDSWTPAAWMTTSEPEYWDTNDGHIWYRAPAEKGNYNHTAGNLVLLRWLRYKGDIILQTQTNDKIKQIIRDCTSYLYSVGWVTEGFDLRTNESFYGLIGGNGYNAILQNLLLNGCRVAGDTAWNATWESRYNAVKYANVDVWESFCYSMEQLCLYGMGRNDFPMREVSYSEDMEMSTTAYAYISSSYTAYQLGKESLSLHQDVKRAYINDMYTWMKIERQPQPYIIKAGFDTNDSSLQYKINYDLDDHPAHPIRKYDSNYFHIDWERIYPLSWRDTSPFYPKDNPQERLDSTEAPPIQNVQFGPAGIVFIEPFMVWHDKDYLT